MIEEWKDIESFGELYQISNLGRVKSLPRLVKSRNPFISKEKIRIGSLSSNGYLSIRLSKDGLATNNLVHRLVAEAFLPNSNNLPEINHKDGIKINCISTNLEWVTRSQNHIHAHKIGLKQSNFKPRYGSKNNKSKLTSKQVEEIRNKFKSGISRKELSKEYGVSITTISSINTHKTWSNEL